MDRRRLDQLFFIYDHSVVQREADDPKDAIAYFYPQNFPIDTQCLLCGQLMGMVNFMKILCSSEPRIYKLRKMKLATLHEGNFTLALAHDPKVSDAVAIGMMRNLYDVFCMYHGSFTRLLKHCHGNRDTFSSQMSSIWNCYLPFIRHYGNSMKTIFHAVPTIELPKKCGQIFLKCSHLLQWLKQKPWLLAGCLLYKNKVLCSQLTSDLMRRLLLVKASQNPFPGEKITTDFDLPFGVRILSIYLHEEEYKLFAKQGSAINIEPGEGDAVSEEALAMVETSQRREESMSRERHPQPATSPPPHLQQLKEDGSNKCNRDSSESDSGRRTSSSPESSDDIGQFTETGDAGMNSERHHGHHGNEDDKTEAEGSLAEEESRTKSPSIATGCRGNGDVKENGRQEHLCRDAKVIDATQLPVEAKGTIDINEYVNGRENKENIDRHNKAIHEHSKQGATSIAFNTKDDKVNGIINHHKDIICGEHHGKNFSSRNNSSSSSVSKDKGTESIDGYGIKTTAPSLSIASYNDDGCLKTAEKEYSGAAGTFSNAVISTAVSELSSGSIDRVLLPKVEVNYDGGNLEYEPFEIHINPLDSESSPEHSDSSGNAAMSRPRLEPLADDNGNILLQDDTGRLDGVDIGADEPRQVAGLENGADDRMFRNIQESVTLSQNNSHSRDSLSQELTPAMQQLSRRASGEQQPPSKTSFPHSYTDQDIPQRTEPNPAKHEGNMDYSSVPEYSTPNASRNPSRSGPSDASASASRQHDWTHHGTNSALHTDNSDHTKQSNSQAAQSTKDQGPGYTTSPVLDKDSRDLRRDPAACDQLEDGSQSPTGSLVRADGTRRRGWTRSRSSQSVTSPTPGKEGVSQRGPEEETIKVEGMVNVSLYVQAHSDVMLIFLGEKDWIQDKSRLLSMWQSFVIKLAELELELQQVLSDKMTNQEQDQLYNFLKFSPYEKSVKTNTTAVMTTQTREFVNVVDAMHEMFISKEHVSHLVMRGQHSTVIGSQNDAYQTYFQPLKAQSNTTTSASLSSLSSLPSSASSSPLMQATTAMATRQGKLEVQAEKMLMKDHGIRFV